VLMPHALLALVGLPHIDVHDTVANLAASITSRPAAYPEQRSGMPDR
jgi:hypothetical protein